MPVNVWLHHVKFSDLWSQFDDEDKAAALEDPATYGAVRDQVVKRLREADFYDDDDIVLASLVNDIELSGDVNEFNTEFNYLYDWCDEARVWLCTITSCPDCAQQQRETA